MPWRNNPDLWGLVGALIISTISGFISIAQRVVRGHKVSVLWVISEFLAAILAGYIMFDTYPILEPQLPAWATLPMLVALAAHIGGRSFQGLEKIMQKRLAGILPPEDTPTT
jgi:hypothetical protein